MDYLRSDCVLREILEERKTLIGFLDAIFGFMSRNTDFYHIQNTKDDELGFPKGVKEHILISCMQKYEHNLERIIASDSVVEASTFVAEEVEIVAEETNEQWNESQQTVNRSDIEMVETSKKRVTSMNSTKFNKSDYKNGSVFDNYCWSQTLKDIELNVILPKEVKLAKHIKVTFRSNYVIIKTLHPKEELLINAETWDKYRHNDVIWSISEGNLAINFDKLKECWWDKLFLNETSINIKTVDTERSIEEYSPDIQSAVDKLETQNSFQEHDFKTLPLNESEQMARLRQAWNSEGSPFKGQPFDPSVIQFN